MRCQPPNQTKGRHFLCRLKTGSLRVERKPMKILRRMAIIAAIAAVIAAACAQYKIADGPAWPGRRGP